MTVSLGQVLAGEIIITATGDLDTTDTAEVIIIMTIFYRTVPDKPSELNPPAVRKLILSSQRQISAASIKTRGLRDVIPNIQAGATAEINHNIPDLTSNIIPVTQ